MYFNKVQLKQDTDYRLSVIPSISGLWEEDEDGYFIFRYVDTVIKDRSLKSHVEEEAWDPDDDMCNGCSYNAILIFKKDGSDREVKIPASWIIEIEPV